MLMESFVATMRNLAPALLLLSVAPTGCGMDVEVSEENISHQIRWTQPPGEIQDCHVFKLDNVRGVEVDRLQVQFPQGSHHVHIYRSNEPTADAQYDCFKGIDWTKWSLVVGAQTEAMDWKLPEGVTIPFEPHQQMLAQVHWLNTTDKTLDWEIDLSFHTTTESVEHLGTVFGVNKRIDIPPGERTRVEQFCPVPAGAKLHAVMGHFHMHGYDYAMQERMPNQTQGQMLYSAPDEPAFQFKTYAPAHNVAPGAGFQFGCSFFNYGDQQITWGSDTKTQEHCNMTAYFSPAEKVSELCVLEPSKLKGLMPAKNEISAGQDLTFAVQLASPESTDLVVDLVSTDAQSLQVPATIKIPKGQTLVSFNAHAVRPGNYEVSAEMNGTKLIRPIRVTGIVVSEVFYNSASGATDGLQWVELANVSNVPLTLTDYSLGAGTADYLSTRLSLASVTIPARGCVVVGGPTSAPENYSPVFALSANLTPDLGLGITQAAGIGLFRTNGLSATSRPLDGVVYGGTNTTLIGPDGQIAPVWPGSAPGGSIKRMTDSVWTKSTAPTPGNCEVLNAL